MTIDRLGEYDAQLSQLETKLEPFRARSPETSYKTFFDELGVRAEAMHLMTAVAELYASTPESRDRIRGMFGRYRFVREWLWPSQEPTTPELFRLWLLGVSMRDAGDDPRDMAFGVSNVCRVAVSAGVDVAPILESVAAISSDQRTFHGRGVSMREVMLEAKRGFSSGRA
jgi:hypothetical protein